MASKSQRQKERHAKKRQEKRKKQEQSRGRQSGIPPHAEIPLGSNARHRQRLSQQIPRAWSGETCEDVAVFDDSVLATLPPEVADHVVIVREVLQETTESRGEEAVKRLSVISRGSPLSEWRLFIRGLVDWLANDTEAASDAWKRLDPERRPGRIATAMILALRTDLEQVSLPAVDGEPADVSDASPWCRWDDQLLYHAKLLRRVRFDRAALRVAEVALKVPEESQELRLGPRKLLWLKQFVKEYGDTEPDLAAALSEAALGQAFAQNYSNIFDEAVGSLPGPRHDRRNQLLTFFYYQRYENDATAERAVERALNQYLKSDLPKNEALSESLRNAIASQIHFLEATALMSPDVGGGMMGFFLRRPEDTNGIRKHFRAALKSGPKNLAAYKGYRDWLESRLDDDRLTQAKRKPLEEELAEVMRSWSRGLPDNIEPRLWLVDYLLESEQLEEARPHVDYLASSRVDDPRARATPWKWQILEAMRLCRRKAWLVQAPARLDEAEAIWPAWLSKQWLPYLRAAWTLRSGQVDAFESQRQQICEASGLVRDSLPDACMMLGAAQQMRVTAEDLKGLRASVDQAMKKLKTVSLEELIAVGGFFWDLHRAQLLYPAYRMHGSSIGKELVNRLLKATKVVLDGINDEAIHKVVLWGSEYRFWPSNDTTRLMPFFANPAIQRHPIFAAARLNAFLKEAYRFASEKYEDLGPLLRQAAESERDPYYRHWFVSLANELDDVKAQAASLFTGFPFGNMFGNHAVDDDWSGEDDDDEEDLGFDPDCNCPGCKAARRAYEKTRTSDGPRLF